MFSDTACILQSKHPFFFQTSCDAQLYLVNNSFFAHFVSRSIITVTDHMQEHTFPDFSLFPLTFPYFPGSTGEWPPC